MSKVGIHDAKYTMVFLIDSGQDTYAEYRKPEGVTHWGLVLYSHAEGREIWLDGGITVFALMEKLKSFRDAGFEVQHFLEVA